MIEPSYTITSTSVSIIWEGKPYVVQADSPHYKGLKKAIQNKDWKAVPNFLTIKKVVASWSQGKFSMNDNSIQYCGEPVPNSIGERLKSMVQRGEDCKPICRFFERLSKNPSKRSVDQLFSFLQLCNIPLTEDGCFLAYKGVRSNMKDQHSGKWDNSPGIINRMPRNKISDDPRKACHEGFHVGALDYAQSFGQRTVVCKVDPQNVVSVPYDESSKKMRVCEYEVIGYYSTKLPSTTIPSRDIPVLKKRWLVEPKKNDSKSPRERRKVKRQLANLPTSTERKRFYRFNKKDAAQLLDQNIHDLRRYATYHLKLVGASKIPGGKAALVDAICKVRGK